VTKDWRPDKEDPHGELKTNAFLAYHDSNLPAGFRWHSGTHLQFTQSDRKWFQDRMDRITDQLNTYEATIARLETELTSVHETARSLREDLVNFSTFEQICNSGMLRNFKIDSESEFAQTILNLLQQTMELQINHLNGHRKTNKETEP